MLDKFSKPAGDKALPPGLIVRSADGSVEVDARTTTRLARARVVLADEIWNALGSGASDTVALAPCPFGPGPGAPDHRGAPAREAAGVSP